MEKSNETEPEVQKSSIFLNVHLNTVNCIAFTVREPTRPTSRKSKPRELRKPRPTKTIKSDGEVERQVIQQRSECYERKSKHLFINKTK